MLQPYFTFKRNDRDPVPVVFSPASIREVSHSVLDPGASYPEVPHPKNAVIVKVKLSLSLTKHHAMNTYWGSGDVTPFILNLGTR
jgi:hypothetical protein